MEINQPVTGSSDVKRLPVRDGYDRWAEIYDDEDNPLILIEEPEVEALLGPVRGLRIADIGCGTGRHALRLAADGAIVTGVDFVHRGKRRRFPASGPRLGPIQCQRCMTITDEGRTRKVPGS